jgi:hypothetical protein
MGGHCLAPLRIDCRDRTIATVMRGVVSRRHLAPLFKLRHRAVLFVHAVLIRRCGTLPFLVLQRHVAAFEWYGDNGSAHTIMKMGKGDTADLFGCALLVRCAP